jgi:hypothetical protein
VLLLELAVLLVCTGEALEADPPAAEVTPPEDEVVMGVDGEAAAAVVAVLPTVDDPEIVGSRAEKGTFSEFEVAFPAFTMMMSVSVMSEGDGYVKNCSKTNLFS